MARKSWIGFKPGVNVRHKATDPCCKHLGYPADAVSTPTMPQVSSGHPAPHLLAWCWSSCTPELRHGRLCAGSPTKSTCRAMQRAPEQARGPFPLLGMGPKAAHSLRPAPAPPCRIPHASVVPSPPQQPRAPALLGGVGFILPQALGARGQPS